MALGFQISVGSVPGRAHIGSGNLLIGKNNQDAFALEVLDDCIIAIVQDGCSSGSHSEIGAQLGARVLSRLIYDSICGGALSAVTSACDATTQLERIRKKFLTKIVRIANCLEIPCCKCTNSLRCSCYAKRLLHDFFLFTTVGLIVTEHSAIFFSIGDGLYAMNGEIRELGPFPENAPPYIAYALLPDACDQFQNLLKFRVHAVLPTGELESALIATDGLKELLDRERALIPGKSKRVGSLEQLWTDDRFFDDQPGEFITPWLRQLNSEVVRFNAAEGRMERCLGLLSDDTTVIALRRHGARS